MKMYRLAHIEVISLSGHEQVGRFEGIDDGDPPKVVLRFGALIVKARPEDVAPWGEDE